MLGGVGAMLEKPVGEGSGLTGEVVASMLEPGITGGVSSEVSGSGDSAISYKYSRVQLKRKQFINCFFRLICAKMKTWAEKYTPY